MLVLCQLVENLDGIPHPREGRETPTSLTGACPCCAPEGAFQKQQPFSNGIANLHGNARLGGVCCRQEE